MNIIATYPKVEDENKVPHPLRYEWSFWFYHRAPGIKSSSSNYASQMNLISSFTSVDF